MDQAVMTNDSAILALIADLYRQIATLQADNAQLHQALEGRIDA